MTKLLENIFGSSWRTSLLGWIFTVSTALSSSQNTLIDIGFSPDTVLKIKNIAAFIAFISGGAAFQNTKDKNVTGGSIPATREAVIRISDEIKEEGTTSLEIQTNLKKLE